MNTQEQVTVNINDLETALLAMRAVYERDLFRNHGLLCVMDRLKNARPAVLDKPARIAAVVFREGIPWSMVVERAQREYEYAQEPPIDPGVINECKNLFAEIERPANSRRHED